MGKQTDPAKPAGDPSALDDAVNRAAAGDESAVAQLRALLRDPAGFEVFGDIALMARNRMLSGLTGPNPLFQQAVPAKLEALRRGLAGPAPTPVESLLVDRVVTNWLHLHALELRRGAAADLGPAATACHERAWDGAHRRYVGSIKALASVRKLALPALQVNVAQNQVNVGSAGAVAVPPEPPAGRERRRGGRGRR